MSKDLILARLSEFTKLIKEGTSLISLSIPDTIGLESPIMELGIERSIKSLSEALNALKALEKWIEARREVYYYAKSVLEIFFKTVESKEDLRSKLRLFVLPRFEYTLSAIEEDKRISSRMGESLSVIKRVTEGHDSSLQRIEAILEFIGYDSRKHKSEIDRFLKAIINEEFEDADTFLEKMRANLERLKRKLDRLSRTRRAII
ncbi:MAG: hypothetical protein ACFE7E_02040 [Candidatus Hodarchaeota archaeon]